MGGEKHARYFWLSLDADATLTTLPIGCAWLCSCCGGMCCVSSLKGFLLGISFFKRSQLTFSAIPCQIILVIGCTGTAIICLPHDIYYTYYSILSTQKIGPNLKFLGIMLLPTCFVCWPPLVFIASSTVGFFYGLFAPFYFTFNPEFDVFGGGFKEIVGGTFSAIKWFWKHNTNSYFEYLEGMRGDLDGDVVDVRLFEAVGAIIIGNMTALCSGAMCYHVHLMKFFPMLLWMYYWYLAYIPEVMGFVTGNLFTILFTPIVGFFALVGLIAMPIFCYYWIIGLGLLCAMWSLNSVKLAYKAGIVKMWIIPWQYVFSLNYKVDKFVNSGVCWWMPDKDEVSLMPCFKSLEDIADEDF